MFCCATDPENDARDENDETQIKRTKFSSSNDDREHKKIPNLEAMNVDEFMEKGFFDAIDAESDEEEAEVRA